MARRPLIVGNWKMNTPEDAEAQIGIIADAVEAASPGKPGVVMCVPATMIRQLHGRGVRIGAQDCHPKSSGAFTGDVSAEMLAAAGASHVIVGHSERRAAYGETDARVAAKAAAAHRAGLTAIICVGESAAERKAGNAAKVVRAQIKGSSPKGVTPANTIYAYEPVWAIGAGAAASARDIDAMHREIRAELASGPLATSAGEVRILYGGSVNAANATEIFAVPDVDGALVGGASLRAIDLLGIVETADAVRCRA